MDLLTISKMTLATRLSITGMGISGFASVERTAAVEKLTQPQLPDLY
jgi:hypothetical protein